MPLLISDLQEALETKVFGAMFEGQSNSKEISEAWADAVVDDYFVSAISCKLFPPIFAPTAKPAFALALQTVFDNALDPVTTANAMAAAFLILLNSPNLIFPPDGLAVLNPAATTAFANAIVGIWLGGALAPLDAAGAAAVHAPLVHTMAAATIVTHSILPVCAGPLIATNPGI